MKENVWRMVCGLPPSASDAKATITCSCGHPVKGRM
jgi:hypothetical protein